MLFRSEQAEDEPITVSVYASQIPAFQGTITVPEGSAQVTISPTQQSSEDTSDANQLELDFESRASEPTTVQHVSSMSEGSLPVSSDYTTNGSTKEPMAEVPFIDNTQVKDVLPVPLGPLAQELRGNEHNDVKEVLERPTSGRPPRFQ